MLARAKMTCWLNGKSVQTTHHRRETRGREPAPIPRSYVWRRDERWRMVVGAGMENGNGAILLYESEDLLTWRYLGPAFQDGYSIRSQCGNAPTFSRWMANMSYWYLYFPTIRAFIIMWEILTAVTFIPESEGFLEKDGVFTPPRYGVFRMAERSCLAGCGSSDLTR